MNRKYLTVIKLLPIFSGKKLEIEELKGGITNANFRIDDGRKEYVARFGFKSNKYLGLNRHQEIYNYRVAASIGLGPHPVEFFPEHNLLLVEYIPGKVFTRNFLRNPQIIKKLVKVLKKLHAGLKFKGTFDPFKISREYFEIVRKNKGWIPREVAGMLDHLKKIESRVKLDLLYPCHLDLFQVNLVYSKLGQIKLLDWEYSANSDWRLDLGQLSAMADFSEKQDGILLEEYRDKLNLQQLNFMKAIMLIREVGWDLVQVRFSKLDFNYKKYTLDNLKRYYRVLKILRIA